MRIALCLLLLVVPTVLFAQSAELSGYVKDPSGANVPNASVELRNQDTGVRQQTTTNQEGIYRIPAIKPGAYVATVQAQGFKTLTQDSIILNVGERGSLDFRLQVGAVSETVNVEGGAPLVNTQDGSVSTVVDQTYVKNMPLNGRSFQDLILLTPGIVTNSPQTGGGSNGGEFSVNGQRTEANYYTVDGVSANVGVTTGFSMTGTGASGTLGASTALGTTQALVSVDSLQEFRVQSSSYSAEYGREPGGQFVFETKSGTNQWHGTAYDYLRNGFFDAPDYFTDYFRSSTAASTNPATRQNDFGGTLGGPVRIPGLYNGKDKTFFFVSYEGLRLAQPQPTSAGFVPDLCMRGKGACPAGRAPAANALLPVVNAFPVPSPNGLANAANGTGQFIGSWSNPSSIDSTSVRIDHNVADRLKLFFRFSDTPSRSAVRSNGANGNSPPTVNAMSDYAMRTYTAGGSTVFSTHLSNDVRLNYSWNAALQNRVIEAFGGGTAVNLAQLSSLGADSAVTINLLFGGSAGLAQSPQAGSQKQRNIVDTVTFSAGRHQFRLGVDYRRLAPVGSFPTNLNYFFFGESNVEKNTPLVFAQANSPARPLYRNFSAFAQDEWRLAQRLSLSLGLRWDVNPPPGVTHGLMPYTIQGTGPANWDVAPQGTPLWKTTWYNFAPRLGVAYILHNAPGREMVVRGGGGVFFDTGQQAGSSGFNGPGFSANSAGGLLPGSFPTNGPSLVPVIPNPPVAPYKATVYGFHTHLQLPYTIQWNASVEQALGKSQALTMSYVASHAARLLKQNIFSVPTNPNATKFQFIENGLTSDYDSLQVQFRRRLSRGLTALASYAWSHCIDYGSSNFDFGYQRGNCGFDVRHNLSTAFSYDLPSMGQNSFLKVLVRHWGLDNRFTARTAFPVPLVGSQLVRPDGTTYWGGLDLVSGQPVYLYGANCATVLQGLGNLAPGQGCPGGRAINPQAFAKVTSGLGNAPRNFARGFDAVQMDLAVRREFPIYENLRLQFRAEAFNIFNHPNFGSINPSFGQQTFGQATSTLAQSLGVLSPLYQQGGPRSMQFALKFLF